MNQLFATALLLASATCSAAERPNIVLILADDLGHGDIGCYGAPDIRTPNVDRLAKEGIRLTQFYSNAPECTPTRTALMTGRYQQRVGGMECALGIGNVGRYDDAIRLAAKGEMGLPPKLSVLPRGLKDAGYGTAIFGKWHLGYEAKFLPRQHGFDRYFGILGGNADYFLHREASPLPILYEDDQPTQRDGYVTHLFVDEAVRFLRQQGTDRPFFLYLPFTTPHSPYQGPRDGNLKLTEANFNKGTRAKYVEMVQDMDEQIGRVLKALDERKLTERTLVIFTSDNGGTKLGRNAPFSGHKSTLFEGGIRVPCVMRWPGRIRAGGESSQVGITMDLTASFLRSADARPPPDLPGDGIDLIRQLDGNRTETARTLFWRFARGELRWRAVRDGDLKYIRRSEAGQSEEWLFDLGTDIAEKNNLLASRPDEAERLRKLHLRWEAEVTASR